MYISLFPISFNIRLLRNPSNMLLESKICYVVTQRNLYPAKQSFGARFVKKFHLFRIPVNRLNKFQTFVKKF